MGETTGRASPDGTGRLGESGARPSSSPLSGSRERRRTPELRGSVRRAPITAHAQPNDSAKLRLVRLIALFVVLLAVAGCSSDEQSSPPPPDAADTRFLDGGRDEFEAYVAEQRGTPVVVNKWASWCGPCRAEFPFFESQAKERASTVEFVGVNSNDNDADAARFLDDYPVPFKHFKDPN